MKTCRAILLIALVLAAAPIPHARADEAPVSPVVPTDAQVIDAASHGRTTELADLLKRGGNARARGAQELPALVYAMISKSAETVEVLLHADPTLANDTFKDPRGQPRSMLAGAVSFKQPALVTVLLKGGADVKWTDADGIGLVMTAVATDNTDELKLLLEAGADPNQRDFYGRTPLSLAAARGNLDTARVLLEHGAWVYPLDATGTSALGLAKAKIKDPANATAMVELLLSHGARADGKNRPIDETYLEAIHRGDQAAVQDALAKGADINARRRLTIDNGVTEPVALAIPYPTLLAYLLDHGADVNACSEYGGTALHFAAGRSGNRDSLSLLVRRGLDVNRADRYGVTALGQAVNQNLPSTAELLIKLGAKATAPGPGGINLLDMARQGNRSALLAPMLEKAGATPSPPGAAAPCTMSTSSVPACALPEVVTQGYMGLVRKGIEGGADVNARDPKGRSLLSLALLLPVPKTNLGAPVTEDPAYLANVERKKATARYLLDHGADVTIADSAGVTVLHQVAAEPRLHEFIAVLLKKGAAIDAIGGTNRVSPLLTAIDAGNAPAATQLLEAGANPNLPMTRGLTPLIGACIGGQLEVAKLLLGKGASVDASAESGATALKIAVSKGDGGLVALLLKAGANPDFDAGTPPSPRVLSRGKDATIQLMFAAPSTPAH